MENEKLEAKLDEVIDHLQYLKGQSLIHQQVIGMLLAGTTADVRDAIKTLVDGGIDYPDDLDPRFLEGVRFQTKVILDALNALPQAPRR